MADDFLNGRPVGSYFVFDEPKQIQLIDWYRDYGFYDAIGLGKPNNEVVTIVAYAPIGDAGEELHRVYNKSIPGNEKYYTIAGLPEYYRGESIVHFMEG